MIAMQTARYMEAGLRVWEIYMVGTSEAHCGYLLKGMEPRKNALIADVGCGVGEVAVQMERIRPDLRFVLFNSNAWQLAQCPSDYPKFQCDMHRLETLNDSYDVVMVNYALGYAHLATFLKEAKRVLKKNGTLFIYDMVSRNSSG